MGLYRNFLLNNSGLGGQNWGRTLASLVAQTEKRLSIMRETWVQSLGWVDPLEKEMATHSSILAWETPWTEEPGRLPFTGSQELDMTERLNHHLPKRNVLFQLPHLLSIQGDRVYLPQVPKYVLR